ncbi:hypothetical protein LDG_8380 [Legionella drancourtii LLAP12]|uniref:Uncharacterized protein n=1 Tax=Legionella drancourtii LLAP12 TaxID=658187 RepID=G9ESV3_9GAMM|nr:hypothetical protein LDG_8380 [Legionella drancourtii LLAP12]
MLVVIAYKHFDLVKELVMPGADSGCRNKNSKNVLSHSPG